MPPRASRRRASWWVFWGGGPGGSEVGGLPGGVDGRGDNPFAQANARGESRYRTVFLGEGASNVKRVVYMIDASGSLIDIFPFVIRALERSIADLHPAQEFTVLFFQGDGYVESPPPGLVHASPEARRRLFQWLDRRAGQVVPGGHASPVAALRQALEWGPDLVYLLSDNVTGTGPYEVDQRHLIDAILEANHAGTRITTFQFVYQDPLVRYGLPNTLESVTELTGGTYRFISAAQIGLHRP